MAPRIGIQRHRGPGRNRAQLAAVGGVRVEVTTLLSSGRTVMVEQVNNSTVNDKPISSVMIAVFELDADGLIMQWREAYDLKSVLDQIKAAADS